MEYLIFEQVHYPSDPQQPGPVYFLTPRKCAIFGVCCKSIPRQVIVYVIHNVNVHSMSTNLGLDIGVI